MNTSRIRWPLTAAALMLGLGACGDLLTVPDPQRYTDEDLDNALDAVAGGVEGALHEVVDSWVIYQALLGDEYQHTGTWSGYDETDHGRFQYGTSAMDGINNAWLRARWFARASAERFERVLGAGEAASTDLMAQVHVSEGLVDLMIGMTFCESPADPTGDAVSAAQILTQAVSKLDRGESTAMAAGETYYATAARAGRATANHLLGNYAAAAADAASIPDGFSYDAIFNAQSRNSVVLLTTKTWNEAAGIQHGYWNRIALSDDAGYMADWATGAPDMRLPVYYDGEIATDNETGHRSQWKYDSETAPIPILHSRGMRLIQAEAAMFGGDFASAMQIVNGLRASVNLQPLPVPTTIEEAGFLLLNERFAEHFMEGRRQIDLHRLGITKDIFDLLNDDERVGTNRPTQFPMSDTEALYNPNIVDDLAQRCLPRAG